MSKVKHYSSIKGFSDVLRRKPLYANILNWVIQEKIDGMNMSVVIDPGEAALGLRGRTTATQYDFSKVELPNREKLIEYFNLVDSPNKVILYGELCGGGIQGKRYFDVPTFVLFDIEYVGQFHTFFFDPDQVKSIGYELGVHTVPFLGTSNEVIDNYDTLCHFITNSLINPALPAEGIVAKPEYECLDKFQERVIYKTRFDHFVGSSEEAA